MEKLIIEAEGNITLACLNPNERLNIPSYTTDADHKCAFGFTVDGHIGIGTPYVSPELDIYKK